MSYHYIFKKTIEWEDQLLNEIYFQQTTFDLRSIVSIYSSGHKLHPLQRSTVNGGCSYDFPIFYT